MKNPIERLQEIPKIWAHRHRENDYTEWEEEFLNVCEVCRENKEISEDREREEIEN